MPELPPNFLTAFLIEPAAAKQSPGMEQSTLEIHAIGLNVGNRVMSWGEVFAHFRLVGGSSPEQNVKISPAIGSGTTPIYPFPVKFLPDMAAVEEGNSFLWIDLKRSSGEGIGEVIAPVKELRDFMEGDGKSMKSVTYLVRDPSGSGKPKGGELSFSYNFGNEVVVEAAKSGRALPANPPLAEHTSHGTHPTLPPVSPPGNGYPPPQPGFWYRAPPPGYGYPPAQAAPAYWYPAPLPGYGYQPLQAGYWYPPPPPVQQQQQQNNFAMGLETVLLGGRSGLLIADIVSGAGSSAAGQEDAGFDFGVGF